jgi:hypothetical protein
MRFVVISSPRRYVSPSTRRPVRQRTTTPDDLRKSIQVAIDEARRRNDPAHWDVVEELSAAASHLPPAPAPIDAWCDAHPDDPECRVYDV